VYGIKTDGTSNLLATVAPAIDSSLAFIDATVYPYLQLKMYATDTVNSTPYQLNYWRINADYLPEGAVAPAILYSMKDTVEQGQQINFSLAFSCLIASILCKISSKLMAIVVIVLILTVSSFTIRKFHNGL